MHSEKILEIKGLKTYFFTEYGQIPAVDGVDLSFAKGEVLGRMGEYDEAMNLFDHALSIKPKNSFAWTGKSAALAKQGKLDEALECVEKAIKSNKKNANAWYNKGEILEKLNILTEANKCYDKAKKIDPNIVVEAHW